MSAHDCAKASGPSKGETYSYTVSHCFTILKQLDLFLRTQKSNILSLNAIMMDSGKSGHPSNSYQPRKAYRQNIVRVLGHHSGARRNLLLSTTAILMASGNSGHSPTGFRSEKFTSKEFSKLQVAFQAHPQFLNLAPLQSWWTLASQDPFQSGFRSEKLTGNTFHKCYVALPAYPENKCSTSLQIWWTPASQHILHQDFTQKAYGQSNSAYSGVPFPRTQNSNAYFNCSSDRISVFQRKPGNIWNTS